MRRLTIDCSAIGRLHPGLVIERTLLREERGLELGETVVLVGDGVDERSARVMGLIDGGRAVRLEIQPSLDEMFAEIYADPVRAARVAELRREMQEGVALWHAMTPEEREAHVERSVDDADRQITPVDNHSRPSPDDSLASLRERTRVAMERLRELQVLRRARAQAPQTDIAVSHLAESRRTRERRQRRFARWLETRRQGEDESDT